VFTIRYATDAYTPDLTVTLRTEADGWADLPGIFEDGAWLFRLDERDYPAAVPAKLVLEQSSWMVGDNLVLHPVAGGTVELTDAEVRFEALPQIIPESGVVTRHFFPPNHDEGHVYDVVVVGSGAGGGILASRLASLGADVLVVEAGSYLFPTHVANLPRRLRVGRFDKHVWGLWPDFSYAAYENVEGSQFAGRQSYNLGGRSLFWGGLIPELGEWEMEGWPAPVREYLRPAGFRLANDALNKTSPAGNAYQDRVKAFLTNLLGDYTHFDAPVAVQYQGYTPTAIPTGMFSTADLLLQHRLIDDEARPNRLTVNLNHAVWQILTEGNRATGVVCDDLLAHTQRTYRGRTIVLSAGTIESAKIALQSGLRDPSGLVGRGITDHTILYRHFSLPPDAALCAVDQAAKVWSRPAAEDAVRRARFNLVLELGADFNQGRYVDADNLRRHNEVKGGSMLCELVFLFETPLGEQNFVRVVGPPGTRAQVRVDRMPVPPEGRAEAERVAGLLFDRLGAEPIMGEPLGLQQAELGGVAHEVGTLRMGAVVDADLRFAEYENLYACDNSVLPTSPAANPTLTLAALALRLAAHLTHP
jgi:choline dehydrogenase-like flavoprotein